jgi:hypothetical protein
VSWLGYRLINNPRPLQDETTKACRCSTITHMTALGIGSIIIGVALVLRRAHILAGRSSD